MPSKPAARPAVNVGTKTRTILLPVAHPDTDAIARRYAEERGETSRVDVMLVNPPTPDGAIWIRSQHRVGRRSRENMIWPQVSLAQMAALLSPTYSVRVIDAVAERMDWKTFDSILRSRTPEVLRDAVDRTDAPERSLRHVPREERGSGHHRVRHPHHADAA